MDTDPDESRTGGPDITDPNVGAPDPTSQWDTDEALAALKMERDVKGDQAPEALMRQMFEEAGPLVAQSIIHIALHSGNDNTRLAAGKYISEELLHSDNGPTKAKWEDLVGAVVSEVELHANDEANH